MKYLYILSSNDTDFLLEQALLSINSLRVQMPDAFISLLVDDITASNLNGKRGEIINLVNEYQVITIEKKFNKKARSRYLKTTMRRYIEGDFLYIDNDTIITDSLSDIENTDCDIGAVLNLHLKISEYKKYSKLTLQDIRERDKKLGFVSTFNSNTHFNGGIIFCRDNAAAHNFFAEWHLLWLYCHEKGNTNDQQSFNQTNYSLGNIIHELEGIWNCQILKDGAIRFLHNSRIIHYFASKEIEKVFLLANADIMKKIKETGAVDDNIKDMLKQAKSLFAVNTRLLLIDESLGKFFDSAFYGAARRIFSSKFGAGIEFLFSPVRKYIFTPIRKRIF